MRLRRELYRLTGWSDEPHFQKRGTADLEGPSECLIQVFHGRNAKYRFGRETDVAFDQQGNIFVSDGYFDARVVKYDKNGRFLAQAGSEKAGTALGEFNLPHGLQVDGQGNV